MATSDDGNGRFDWLKDDLNYIKGKLDQLSSSYSCTAATVRSHSAAIKWLYGLVAAVFVVVVALAIGVRQ